MVLKNVFLHHRSWSWGPSEKATPLQGSLTLARRLDSFIGVLFLRVIDVIRGWSTKRRDRLALWVLGSENCSNRLFISCLGVSTAWHALGCAQSDDRAVREGCHGRVARIGPSWMVAWKCRLDWRHKGLTGSGPGSGAYHFISFLNIYLCYTFLHFKDNVWRNYSGSVKQFRQN